MTRDQRMFNPIDISGKVEFMSTTFSANGKGKYMGLVR
jgi:hypothetical protein